jgi:hypothetical protein
MGSRDSVRDDSSLKAPEGVLRIPAGRDPLKDKGTSRRLSSDQTDSGVVPSSGSSSAGVAEADRGRRKSDGSSLYLELLDASNNNNALDSSR